MIGLIPPKEEAAVPAAPAPVANLVPDLVLVPQVHAPAAIVACASTTDVDDDSSAEASDVEIVAVNSGHNVPTLAEIRSLRAEMFGPPSPEATIDLEPQQTSVEIRSLRAELFCEPSPEAALTDIVASNESGVTSSMDIVASNDSDVTGSADIVASNDSGVTGLTDIVASKDSDVTGSTDIVASRDSDVTSSMDIVAPKDLDVTSSTDIVASTDWGVTSSMDIVASTDLGVTSSTDIVASTDSGVTSSTDIVAPTEVTCLAIVPYFALDDEIIYDPMEIQECVVPDDMVLVPSTPFLVPKFVEMQRLSPPTPLDSSDKGAPATARSIDEILASQSDGTVVGPTKENYAALQRTKKERAKGKGKGKKKKRQGQRVRAKSAMARSLRVRSRCQRS